MENRENSDPKMTQKPIKKVKIKAKPTRYQKVSEKRKSQDARLTKAINKKIIDKFEREYKSV